MRHCGTGFFVGGVLLCVAPAHGQSSGVALPPASFDDSPLDPNRPGWPGPDDPNSGFYIRASGLFVQPSDSSFFDPLPSPGRDIDVAFDESLGFSLAFGSRFEPMPISVEIEWTWSDTDVDNVRANGVRIPARGDLTTSFVGFNVLYEETDLWGPVGFYAGGGVGFSFSEFSLRTEDGDTDVTARANGEDGLALRLMAGLSFELAEDIDLITGIRFTKIDDIEAFGFDIDTESFDIEVGLRFWF